MDSITAMRRGDRARCPRAFRIFDGDICCLDPDGTSNFNRLLSAATGRTSMRLMC